MEHRAGDRDPTSENSTFGKTILLSAAQDGDAAPDHEQFLMALKSKEGLVSVPDSSLFVWDGERDLEIGVIVQIGVEGLVFEYFDLGWIMAEEGRFDLLTDAAMCITGLAYRLLSDELVEEEEPSPVPIRRARIRFGPLTPAKQTALETLMSIYGNRAESLRRGRCNGSDPDRPKNRLETVDPPT
jgi:hypothetical protein